MVANSFASVSPAHPLLPHTGGEGACWGVKPVGWSRWEFQLVYGQRSRAGSVGAPQTEHLQPPVLQPDPTHQTKVIKHILKPAAYRRGDWMTLQASHSWHCRIMWIYGFEKVETDKIMKTVENLSWVVLLIPSQDIKIVGTDQKGSKSSTQHQQWWFVQARNRNGCMEKTIHRETGQPAGKTWQLSSKGFIWFNWPYWSFLPLCLASSSCL